MLGRKRKGYTYPGQGVSYVEGVANVEGVCNLEGEANVEGKEANVEDGEVNVGGETNMEGEETDDFGSHNSSLDTFITRANFGIDDTGFNLEFVEENNLERKM